MRYRIVVAALLIALATPGAAAPVPVAAAEPGACTGVGTMTTSGGYEYPGLDLVATTSSFVLTLDLGVCVPDESLQAYGTLSGWCGMMSGRGTANGEYDFAFIGGGDVVVEGEALGHLTITPNALAGSSCAVPAGANSFIVTAELALRSCNTTVSPQTEMPQGWTVYHHKCL